jgi:hypothetical protein
MIDDFSRKAILAGRLQLRKNYLNLIRFYVRKAIIGTEKRAGFDLRRGGYTFSHVNPLNLF